jgi:hypothetical protein
MQRTLDGTEIMRYVFAASGKRIKPGNYVALRDAMRQKLEALEPGLFRRTKSDT